jgi:phosphotransferase system enzyme I (PtsI)
MTGIAAADGIAVGEAFVIDRRRVNAPKYHIQPAEIEEEVVRLRRAIETTDLQLQRIKEKLYWAGGEDHTLILQAHQLILQDEQLVEQTIRHIREEKINAEWALRRTVTGIKQLFDQVENDYFRERRSDVDFVADHLLVTLSDKKPVHVDPPPETIVVAHELAPADLARLYRCQIQGFVTESGGRNSHTSIVARSLAIPAVVGLADIFGQVGSGDPIVVDGYRGEVVVCPDEEVVRRYQRRAQRRTQHARGLRRERELPAETQDGVGVRLLANVEFPDEIPGARAHGAEGIGLYRTEFLYLGRRAPPTEEEHLEDALRVLEHAGGQPATFRTCDLGVDKLPGPAPLARESNPALGLRSIRLCFQRGAMFKTQLRALLRASAEAHGSLRVMFPMISGVEDVRQARRMLEECAAELAAEGKPALLPPLGAMIEMPSAAVTADLIAREVDFLSIGTNDLTQYALAVDRTNELVNQLGRSHHPSMLRLIRSVVQAAEAANIPLTLCGEMAADPLMTLLLLGLGVRELSMNALALPMIKRVIRTSTVEAARRLLARVLELSTPAEIEEEVMRAADELFPNQLRPEEEDTQS